MQRWASQKRMPSPTTSRKAIDAAGGKIAEWLETRETNLLYTVKRGLGNPLLITPWLIAACAMLIFGIRRVRRRAPYLVQWQNDRAHLLASGSRSSFCRRAHPPRMGRERSFSSPVSRCAGWLDQLFRRKL